MYALQPMSTCSEGYKTRLIIAATTLGWMIRHLCPFSYDRVFRGWWFIRHPCHTLELGIFLYIFFINIGCATLYHLSMMYVTVYNMSFNSNCRILAAELNYRFTGVGPLKGVFSNLGPFYDFYPAGWLNSSIIFGLSDSVWRIFLQFLQYWIGEK